MIANIFQQPLELNSRGSRLIHCIWIDGLGIELYNSGSQIENVSNSTNRPVFSNQILEKCKLLTESSESSGLVVLDTLYRLMSGALDTAIGAPCPWKYAFPSKSLAPLDAPWLRKLRLSSKNGYFNIELKASIMILLWDLSKKDHLQSHIV